MSLANIEAANTAAISKHKAYTFTFSQHGDDEIVYFTTREFHALGMFLHLRNMLSSTTVSMRWYDGEGQYVYEK